MASGQNGILITFSNNNLLSNNKIGTDGIHNWGNTYNGIGILESEGTVISANKIAYTGPSSSLYDGIKIFGSAAINNKISENSIHDNGGKGINFLSGANPSIAPPVIVRDGQTISGTTCSYCNVEFFSDAQDEGRFFEGSVGANVTGNFSWTGDVKGQFVTATATNNISKNTSMFSTPIPAPFSWMMFLPAMTGKQ